MKGNPFVLCWKLVYLLIQPVVYMSKVESRKILKDFTCLETHIGGLWQCYTWEKDNRLAIIYIRDKRFYLKKLTLVLKTKAFILPCVR